MSVTYQLQEWLQRAFTDQADSLNESYYFDRLANEFYSVFITDYFLTDPAWKDNVNSSPYSGGELAALSERISRRENKDPSLVLLPRLTVEERKQMMKNFLDAERLDDPTIQAVVDSENGRRNLGFGSALSPDMEEKWREFKGRYVQEKIEDFCHQNKIDLETARLWTDEKMTTLNLGLGEKRTVKRRPWWKFW